MIDNLLIGWLASGVFDLPLDQMTGVWRVNAQPDARESSRHFDQDALA